MEMAGQILHVYASGDGALHFNWAYPDGMSSGRKVLRWHCLRFLRTKEGKRLTAKGFKLFNINTQWQLVTVCVRKNKNTLCMDGECYTYAIVPMSPRIRQCSGNGHEVWDCDLKVWAKWPDYVNHTKFATKRMEVKNLSIRAGIRYFLSHEEELNRADDKGIVHYAAKG